MKSNDESIAGFVLLLLTYVLGTMTGFCVLAYEFYVFFRFGQWPFLTITTALQWFDVEWSLRPYDWIGLYNTLNEFPLSLALFVGSALPAIIYIYTDNQTSKG